MACKTIFRHAEAPCSCKLKFIDWPSPCLPFSLLSRSVSIPEVVVVVVWRRRPPHPAPPPTVYGYHVYLSCFSCFLLLTSLAHHEGPDTCFPSQGGQGAARTNSAGCARLVECPLVEGLKEQDLTSLIKLEFVRTWIALAGWFVL